MRVFSNVAEKFFRPGFGTSRAPEHRTHFCLLTPECGNSRQGGDSRMEAPANLGETNAQSTFAMTET